MSTTKRWSQMICLAVLAVLLCVLVGTGTAEEVVPATISGTHWVRAGEAVTIHVSGLEQASDWYYQLYDCTAHKEIEYVRKQAGTAAPGDVSYAGSVFQADHIYRFETWNCPLYSYFYFYVCGDAVDNNISISIEGNPEEILVNKNYTRVISAPGAYMIAYKDLENDYWNYANSTNASTGTYVSTTDFDEGHHTIIAKAFYGEPDYSLGYDEWDWGPVCAVPLDFDTVSYGPAPIPTLHVEQDSYTRGEFVTVNVESDLTKINHLELDVRRTDSQDGYYCVSWDSGDEFDGRLVFSTARMEPGEYMLDIRSQGEGYEYNQAYLAQETFTVTEAPAGSVTLRVSSENVLMNDSYTYSCYAPGASETRIYQVYSYGDDCITSGQTYTYGNSTIYSSDVTLYAVAIRYDDAGNEIRTQTDPVIIHPIIKGNLDAAVVVPKLARAGQDLTIALNGMEKANKYWSCSVYDQTTGQEILYRYESRTVPPAEVTISGDLLKAGHDYYVSVEAQGKGYNRFYGTRYFCAYDGELDTNIAFAIDGGTVPEEIYVNKTYEMTISAEGATAIAWLDDSYGSWQYEILDENEQAVRRTFRTSSKGRYSVVAKACYDPISGYPGYSDLNWSAPGAAMLDCSVTSKGPAAFTLSDLPETVPAGTDLTVHWVPQCENQSLCRELSAPGVHMGWGSDEYEESDMLFKGKDLNTPGSYTLEFRSSADCYDDAVVKHTFTVVANSERPAAPVPFVKNATIYRDIRFNVNFNELQEDVFVEIKKTEGNYSQNGSNTGVDRLDFTLGETGTYDVYVTASVNGVWSELTKTLTITVEDIPTVSELTPVVPEQVSIGEEFTITAFTPAKDGRVYLTFQDAEGKIIYDNYNYVYTSSHYTEFRIWNYQLIERETVPGTATAVLTFRPDDGTDEQVKTASLTIAGEQPEKPTLTYESMIVEAGTPLRLSGTAGSAEKISLRYEVEHNGSSRTYQQKIDVAGGKWTAEIPANVSGKYYVTVSGSKGGLFTGSAYATLFVTGEDSLPAPVIDAQINEDWPTEVNLHFTSPDTQKTAYWYYWWTTEDGTPVSSDSEWTYGEDCYDWSYFNYSNTYVLSVVYSIDSHWSEPTTATVAITGGRPWPVNGPLPIDAEVPENWVAGQDLVIHWTPSVEDQTVEISMYNTASGDWVYPRQSSLAAEGDSCVLGYYLEPGTYKVRFNSRLDTWEDTTREYRMTVTANNDRPDAPAVTVSSGTIYEHIPFRMSLDKQWEAVFVEVRKEGSSSWQERNSGENTDFISTSISTPGTYDLYVSGSVNHVWSEKQKAGTITVEPIPTVSEITLLLPEQITVGEDLPVTAFLPMADCQAGIRILDASGSTICDYGSDWASYRYVSRTYSAEDLVNNGIKPGTVTVEVTVRPSGSETTEEKTATVKVVGESFERPTVKADSPVGQVGTPNRIGGVIGSADQILVSYQIDTPQYSYSYTSESSVSGDGWTAEISTPMSGTYRIRVKGYKGSLCTGSTSMEMIVTGADSLPAPTISVTVNPDYPTEAQIHYDSPDDENEVYWRYWWTTEDGEAVSSGSDWTDEGEDYNRSHYFDYQNTYVLTTVYRIGSVWSAPSTANVTITGGRPWPIYGKLPIDVNVPQTWPAGTDLTIHWTPSVEGQRAWVNVWNEKGDNLFSKVSNLYAEGDFSFYGSGMEPGAYRVEIGSDLDYWEMTWKTYRFTVTENTQRPDAPEVTLSEGTYYEGIPFDVLFAEEQEGVYAELWTTGDNPYREDRTNRTFTDCVSLSAGNPGIYDVYVSASVNSVWSEKQKVGQISVQALPEVSEITLMAPDQLTIGENLKVTALLPKGIERLGLRLLRANGMELDDFGIRRIYKEDKYATWEIDAEQLFDYDIQPGQIKVEVKPYTTDFEPGPATTKTVQVTGSVPERPTLENPPKMIEKGTPILLRGTVGSAEHIRVTCYQDSSAGGTDYNVPATVAAGTWTAEIPTRVEGRYNITVTGFKGGLCTGKIYEEVFVTGENSLPAPTISASLESAGSTYVNIEAVAPESRESVQWRYWWTAENGTVVYENTFWTPGGANTSTGNGFTYSGTYTLTMLCRANSVWSAPATATVTVTNGRPWPVNGPLTIDPEVPETWLAGKDLTIRWVPAEDGQTLSMNAYDPAAGRYLQTENSWLNKEGDMVVSGAGLEAGSYVLTFTSRLDTWEDTEKQYTLTVVENENRPGTGAVTVTPENLTTLTRAIVKLDKVYDRIAAKVNGRSMVNSGNSDQVTVPAYWFEEGENTIAVQTRTGDVWSVPKTLTVTVEEAPTLSDPQITVDSTVQVGKPVPVTIRCDENVERMSVYVRSEELGYATYSKDLTLTGNQVTLTVPEDAFEPGENSIEVSTEAEGYYSAHSMKKVTITGERPDAPAVSFSKMKGEPGDTVYATVRTNGTVEMELSTEYMDDSYYYSPIGGKCVIPVELNFYGETDYRFRAKVNGVQSKWTDTFTLTTKEAKKLEEPAGGFVIFPQSIEPGKDVKVTFREVEGAERYCVDVQVLRHDGDSEWTGWLYGEEIYEPGTITIPAEYFYNGGYVGISAEAGARYRAVGENTYFWDRHEYDVEPVDDSSWASLAVTIDKTQALIEEPITVKLQNVKADEIIVTQIYDNGVESNYGTYYGWNGEKLSEITVNAYETGTFRFKVRAKVNGKWTKESNMFVVQVKPYAEEALENPVIIEMPARIMEGQALTFRWKGIDGAEAYDVTWYSNDSNWHENRVEQGTSYTIAAGDLDGPGVYTVYVTSIAANRPYEWHKVYRSTVTVVGELPGNTLTLPAALTEIEAEAFAGVQAEAIVVPESCTKIGSKAFADCKALMIVKILGSDTTIAADAFQGCGDVIVIVPEGSKTAQNLLAIGITPEYEY